MTAEEEFHRILNRKNSQGDIIPFFNNSPVIDNPYPYFDKLRERSPILWMADSRYKQGGFYIVTGYNEIREVLQSQEFGHKVTNLEAYVRKSDLTMEEFIHQNKSIESVTSWMLTKNRPEHSTIRDPFSQFFSREAVSQWKATIENFVEDAFEQEPEESIEFVRFFKNITLKVICSIIGYPLEDFNKIRGWTEKLVWLLIGRDMSPSERQSVNITVMRMFEYIQQLIEDDIPDGTILSYFKDLSNQDLRSAIHNLIFLSFAGYETTTSLLSNLVHELVINPDLWVLLRQSDTVMEDAINEILRLQAPVQRISRSSLKPTILGNHDIAQGVKVQLFLGAGNRDTSVFSDPQSFKLDRREPNHLSFGGGYHHCLGSKLAIFESAIICQHLLFKISKFQLIRSPQYRQNFTIRGLKSLHLDIDFVSKRT